MVDGRFGGRSDAWDLEPRTGLRLPGWAAGTTVLAHGVSRVELPLLLSAWTWVASASDAQLVVLTAEPRIRDAIQIESKQLGVAEAVVVPTDLEPRHVPWLYARARVLLLTETGGAFAGVLGDGEPSASGSRRRAKGWARCSAMRLPRATRDARALGAACLSLLVDDRLSADLSDRGGRRIESLVSESEVLPLADHLRRIILASDSEARAT